MNEEWKPVKGYEGLYEVSNLGRVRSISQGKIAKFRPEHKGRVLKPYQKKNGYLIVDLYYAPKKKHHCHIHRLVAEAFIQNPKDLPCINHKDEDPTNNVVNNLEWCTTTYNLEYNGRAKRVGIIQGHPVEQISVDGKVIATYHSIHEAVRVTGITHIWDAATGKVSHAGGFIWRKIAKS